LGFKRLISCYPPVWFFLRGKKFNLEVQICFEGFFFDEIPFSDGPAGS
jgi:hypothetical protein